jgi:hypothetical protein
VRYPACLESHCWRWHPQSTPAPVLFHDVFQVFQTLYFLSSFFNQFGERPYLQPSKVCGCLKWWQWWQCGNVGLQHVLSLDVSQSLSARSLSTAQPVVFVLKLQDPIAQASLWRVKSTQQMCGHSSTASALPLGKWGPSWLLPFSRRCEEGLRRVSAHGNTWPSAASHRIGPQSTCAGRHRHHVLRICWCRGGGCPADVALPPGHHWARLSGNRSHASLHAC